MRSCASADSETEHLSWHDILKDTMKSISVSSSLCPPVCSSAVTGTRQENDDRDWTSRSLLKIALLVLSSQKFRNHRTLTCQSHPGTTVSSAKVIFGLHYRDHFLWSPCFSPWSLCNSGPQLNSQKSPSKTRGRHSCSQGPPWHPRSSEKTPVFLVLVLPWVPPTPCFVTPLPTGSSPGSFHPECSWMLWPQVVPLPVPSLGTEPLLKGVLMEPSVTTLLKIATAPSLLNSSPKHTCYVMSKLIC